MDYSKRSERFKQIGEKYRSQASQMSIGRGILFLFIAFSLVYYYQSTDAIWLIIAGTSAAGFLWLVHLHSKRNELAEHNEMLALINLEECKRKQLDLHEFNSGEQYLTQNHPYAADLDIFGQHSIFQSLNRSSIPDSERLLARWLSHKSEKAEIFNRQECAIELAKDPDWYQSFQALVKIALNKKKKKAPAVSASDLLNWAGETDKKDSKFRIAVAIISNLITIAVIALITFTTLSINWLYTVLAINGLILSWIVRKLSTQIKGIDKALYLIMSYQHAIQHILKQDFNSPKLSKIHSTLKNNNAEKAINELAAITQKIDSRSNMFYAILDVVFLPDAYLSRSISLWREKYQADIAVWLQVIHETECLISIAGFSAVNENFSFPVILDSAEINAVGLGHPLIAENKRVCNSYHIAGKGHLDIITGSNMSGKSTFQRTLGVNLVLAYTGAPVCAQQFSAGIFSVFTSMRTKDNLEENTSSFYAELKRIKQLLDLTKDKDPVFYLLDEILKGTNSEDRHKGAIALATQLSESSAMGLISTHDLLLGKETASNPKIRNFSFNSEIDGNRIVFDYLLTEGICKSFNASQLMKNMGILN